MKTGNTLFGMPVNVQPDIFPVRETPREQATRIVRNGLADVLEWLGEEVGPRVGAEVHGVITTDVFGVPVEITVSRELYEKLAMFDPDLFEAAYAGCIEARKTGRAQNIYAEATPEGRLAWAREQLETRIAIRRAHDYYSRFYSHFDPTIRITYTKEPT